MIRFILQQKILIVIILLGVCLLGIQQYQKLPVDAFPDISPIMVPVFAEAHGMAPEEIERLITIPIESAMNGLPGVKQLKSTSAFGMAVVYVYFHDSVDIWFARQIVAERLNEALAELPEMHEKPFLGPISSGLGQVFIYYLTLDPGADTGGLTPSAYLRDINDWVVKYRLKTVPGVTDVLSMGGDVLQYQVQLDPRAMRKFSLSMDDVVGALRRNNRNAGGQFLVLGQEEYLVRGLGLLQELEDIRRIPVRVNSGMPVLIQDIAEVNYGSEIRRGVVTRNGEQEVVSGIVFQLWGENSSTLIPKLYAEVAKIQQSLPQGAQLVPFYEQAELVRKATGTVKDALLFGAILVLITLGLFLGHLPSALVVALALPFSALFAVLCMRLIGLSANLMSLGGLAIAIGMLCDGAIVVVENIYRHVRQDGVNPEWDVTTAVREVARPVVFSILIIIIVFLPIFTLEGVEGKMFSPMAWTISFALLGSLFYAIAGAPVLASWLIRHGKGVKEFFFLRLLREGYRPLLAMVVRRPVWPILLALLIFALSMTQFWMIGTEFIPVLEEGSILIGVSMPPSISLERAVATVMELEKRIVKTPGVKETVSRIGRPEAGSHPHPVNYAEIHVEFEQHAGGEEGRLARVAALQERVSNVPGVQLNFTQPIQNAFDELLSGIRAQLAVIVSGEDLAVLRRTAEEIRGVIQDVPGLVDLSVEQSFGQPQVQVLVDRAACSRYGVTVGDVLELVELAVGGEVVDSIYRNTRRYGLHVRYQSAYRATPEAIRDLFVVGANGESIPLAEVATVKETIGPVQIQREKNQRRWIVQGNIRGRDLGSVVAEIRERISQQVKLPVGCAVDFGGQFENQQRAMDRLSMILPVCLGLIVLMLYMTFGEFRPTAIILLGVPLALIGGVAGLRLTGEYLSVPAAVGFIALFGIAVQNGLVLVAGIRQCRAEGKDIKDAVTEASLLRLRPVLMTALTTVLGLLPLLLSHGVGSEVQRPLAVVVVYGLVSSTLLTLFVVPATCCLFGIRERKMPDDPQSDF